MDDINAFLEEEQKGDVVYYNPDCIECRLIQCVCEVEKKAKAKYILIKEKQCNLFKAYSNNTNPIEVAEKLVIYLNKHFYRNIAFINMDLPRATVNKTCEHILEHDPSIPNSIMGIKQKYLNLYKQYIKDDKLYTTNHETGTRVIDENTLTLLGKFNKGIREISMLTRKDLK